MIEAPSHHTVIDWIVGSAAPGARLDRHGEAGGGDHPTELSFHDGTDRIEIIPADRLGRRCDTCSLPARG